jgi:hypothetical protein
MGGMDPQVSPIFPSTIHSLIIISSSRISSVNSLEVVVDFSVALEEVAVDRKGLERQKISFIVYTSPSKISTKAKLRNSP